MINSVSSLVIILMFSFFLHVKLKIKSGLSPIISLTSIISFVVIFSLFKLLFVGVVLAYVIVICLFVYTLLQKKGELKIFASSFFDVGVVLFIVASALMLLFLSVKQPLFSEWDEFSFWGTSQKLLSINNQIYTYYDSSLIGNTTPPTLAVLSYFFGAFSPQFSEWVSFFAYDVMFFAISASFTAMFKKEKQHCAIMMFLLGFLLPYFFSVYSKAVYLIPVYINTYADIPLGMMFSACIAVYFIGAQTAGYAPPAEPSFSTTSASTSTSCAKEQSSGTGAGKFNGLFSFQNLPKPKFSIETKNILALLPLIFFLTLIKDMGFALSCLVAFFVFFDLFFHKKHYSFFVFKNAVAKILASVTVFFVAVGAFLGWSYHMGAVMSVNRFNLGGQENIGMVEMLFRGVTELFSNEKSEKFTTISTSMVQAFFNTDVSMIGSCFVVICAITLMFIFAFIISSNKHREKARVAALYFAGAFGFTCYYIFNIFLYVYIFKDNGYALPSFDRYIYPYLFGWFMLAVILILLSTNKHKVTDLFKHGAVSAGVLFVFTLFSFLVGTSNMFLTVDTTTFSTRNTIKQKVALLGDVVEDDDVIYFFSGMADYGMRWFIYTLEYAENIIVMETTELGQFGEGIYDGTTQEANEAARQHIIDDYRQKGVTHLMIDYSDFVTEVLFAEDFEEPTVQYGLTGIAYYEVEYIGDDDIEFHLLKGGHITDD